MAKTPFNKPSFDVKEYGAKGDGVTDDTAAIQAAIDTAAASGGTTYFQAGVYRISIATSILLRSGVSLVGAGRDQTILLPTSTAAGSVIKRVAPASGGDYVEDIVIQGVGIVLNHTAPADPGNSEQIGFDFRHVTRSVIQDCYVGNYNKGNAGSFHTDPTNQANAAQGYGIVFGTYSSGNPLYSGGEVNRVVRTAVVGTKKAIVLDDLTLSPSSAAHATVIDSCDIQVAESGIAQESQYGTGNSFVNNTIQSIRNATGSSNTTYAVRIEGYSSVVTGGYTEVTSDCDYGLRLGSASASNYVRPHRVSSAATDISDIGTNNDVVVLDGTDAVHYGRQKLARGLIVEGSGASLGTWTTSNWPKTVQIGADSSDSTLRFPLNNGVQFGFAADSAGGRLFMLRSTAADNSAVASFPMVWETDGRLGLSLPGAVYPTAKLTIGAGTAIAGSAPLKFTSGPLNTTPEAGAIEFLTNALYYVGTDAARRTIAALQNENTWSAAQLMGGSSVLQPLHIFRDASAGDSSNLVQFKVGNANSDSGDIVVRFTNGAASGGTMSGAILFFPRTNDNSTNFQGGGLSWTKNAGGNTCDMDLTVGSARIYGEGGTGDIGIGNNDPADRLDVSGGNVRIRTVGKGLKIAEGSNARLGISTLVAGTVTVANTSITANTRVFPAVQTAGGTQGFLSIVLDPGVGFTINSTSGSETSTVAWTLIEPA